MVEGVAEYLMLETFTQRDHLGASMHDLIALLIKANPGLIRQFPDRRVFCPMNTTFLYIQSSFFL